MSDATTDTTGKALIVALTVGFICAVLVSAVSVGLRPLQKANIEAERVAQLELVIKALSGIGSVQSINDLVVRIVDLETGQYTDGIDAATFNAERAATQPASSIALAADSDIAGLKRRERHALIYLVLDAQQRPDLIILPIRGRGYQSMLYAWLALDGDTQTVRALKFYQHGETPGVGARILEPEWEGQWQGLRAFDDQGVLRIGVKRQAGSSFDEYATYKVDAISGATRTTQGVDGMVRFWLGKDGFAPFLKRLQQGDYDA